MKKNNFLKKPLSAIVFDCDGTLSQIEGIDYLAKLNNVEKEVCELTHLAMTQTGLSSSLYQQRLDLVKPTKDQVISLGEIYYQHISPDAENIITLFQKLDKKIYIFSAGVNPAVILLGEKLNIAAHNIFAVDLQFDQNNHYLDFNHTSPLINKNGKQELINLINQKSIGYIGDGMNDLAVINHVERFVGYGGAFYRENIKKQCDFYLTEKSFLPLLQLFLTEDEQRLINVE